MHIIVLWIIPHHSCLLLYKCGNDEVNFARTGFLDVGLMHGALWFFSVHRHLFCLTVTVFTCACVCVCVRMCVCNLSSRRGAASTNLMTSVCRAYPALHPLAPVKDAQPIKLAGQVLRIISINGNIKYVFSGIWVFALNCSCNLYVPMMT